MYDGGTNLEDAAKAVHAKATISMQEFCTEKTLDYAKSWGHETVAFNHPIGVAGDRQVPDGSVAHHRQADPGCAGARSAAAWSTRSPTRTRTSTARSSRSMAIRTSALASPGSCWNSARSRVISSPPTAARPGKRGCRQLLASSPFGANCHVYAGKDLWHMRSLLFTEPVDFLIGNTYGKYLERDTGTPLIRIGFPIFDRHHHHRYPGVGLPGRDERAGHDPRQDLRRDRPQTNMPAKTDYQLRHHPLNCASSSAADRPWRSARTSPGER